jgi:hypothetical protein
MTGFWLISYVVLWIMVVTEGLVILALAREIEALHSRVDKAEQRLHRMDGKGEAVIRTEKAKAGQ